MPFYKGQNCKVEIRKIKKRKPFKLIIPIDANIMIPPWYGLIFYRFGPTAKHQGYATIVGLNVILRFLYDLYVYIRCGSNAIPPNARSAYMQGRMDERAELKRAGRLKP